MIDKVYWHNWLFMSIVIVTFSYYMQRLYEYMYSKVGYVGRI